MKPKHIFWGLLFITIGILILLHNFGSLSIDLDGYWKFWPLVLVLFGISFVIRSNWLKSILSGLSGIILAIALFSIFSFAFSFVNNDIVINDNGVHFNFDDNDTGFQNYHYEEAFTPGTKKAKFIFNAGAGTFIINDSTDKLISANSWGTKNNYNFSTSEDNGNAFVKMKMKERRFNFGFNNEKNRVSIKLNTLPVWDMDYKLGAASVDFNLTPYKTKNVNIHIGVASLSVRLGDKSDTTNLDINAGVSSIKIYVPESSGCEINADASLSSKDFEDFQKYNSHFYKTDNFDSAKKKIFLTIKTGVSSITVHRYSSGW